MNTILATYDLRGRDETSQDYARLIAELKAYKNVINPLYSVWLIQTAWTAKQVRDNLVRWIDDDDRLLVIDVTGGSVAWHRLQSAHVAWLRNSP